MSRMLNVTGSKRADEIRRRVTEHLEKSATLMVRRRGRRESATRS